MNQDDDDVDYSSDASSQVGGHEGKELAKRLGAAPSMWPEHANEPVNKAVDEAVNELHDLHEDARASLVDVNGLAREEGDDGAYEDSPSKSKGKGKAQATPTVKGASKPKGVTKNRAAPKKKEQTSAQLLTAAAKSREPPKIKRASTKRATPKKEQTPAQLNTAIAETLESAKPKATEKASTIPSQAATTPVATPAHVSYNGNKNQSPAATVPDEIDQKIARVQASMGPAQERGIKRTLEQLPDDEEDSPATKKAKVGSAVSVNGGRKKATPKKSKQKGLQEWDGVPRGFGEYHNY